MPKKYLFATALLAGGLLPGAARAQVSKFSGALGMGLVPMYSSAPTQANPAGYYGTPPGYVIKTYDTNLFTLNANLSFDAPLLQFSGGEQSVGVSLNAGAGLMGTTPADRDELDGFNGQLMLDFPQYLTYRYGAKASKHSKKDFGVGAGLGYRYSRFFLPFSSPSAMLELTHATDDADWYLRLSADLRPQRFYDEYSSEGLVEVLRLRQITLLIGKSF